MYNHGDAAAVEVIGTYKDMEKCINADYFDDHLHVGKSCLLSYQLASYLAFRLHTGSPFRHFALIVDISKMCKPTLHDYNKPARDLTRDILWPGVRA